MISIIIDTQVLLWWFLGNQKLKVKHRKIIDDPSVNIYLSQASLIELYIKASIGKLVLPEDLEKSLQEYQIQILDIKFDHLNKYLSLPLLHRDPFDRIIISQAKVENFNVISYDKEFLQYDIKMV